MKAASTRAPWTKTQIRDARQQPLKPVLETLGYQFTARRDGNYELIGFPGPIVRSQTLHKHFYKQRTIRML